MSTIDEVILKFGQSMGIEGLRMPEVGGIRLGFENRGLLSLEQVGESLTLCLVREFDARTGPLPVYRRALEACHYRQGLPFNVFSGLRGDSLLVFAIEIEAGDLTLPMLERALSVLTDLHSEVI